MPLIKSGAKAIGKQALKGGLGFASDVLAGKNAKEAAVERAKMAGSSLLRQIVTLHYQIYKKVYSAFLQRFI